MFLFNASSVICYMANNKNNSNSLSYFKDVREIHLAHEVAKTTLENNNNESKSIRAKEELTCVLSIRSFTFYK